MDPDLFMEGGDLYEFIHLLFKFMKFEFHRNGSEPPPPSPNPQHQVKICACLTHRFTS